MKLSNEQTDRINIPAAEPSFDPVSRSALVSTIGKQPGVVAISAAFLLLLIVSAVLFHDESQQVLIDARIWTIVHFDWLFMISCNLFLLFCLALIVSPFGRIRLGGITAQPDFTNIAWGLMLFAAGIGSSLMFWSVVEPVAYYTSWYGTPLNVPPKTPEAAKMAMGATMFHWGLHPWAIYAVIGLTLAFFSYNKALPLAIRSPLFPLIGTRCWGASGHAIDLLAVLATVFGMASSLGLGAQQIAGGLHYLLGIKNSLGTQLGVTLLVMAIAAYSVARQQQRLVSQLGRFNLWITMGLVALIFMLGPTLRIFETFGTMATSYAREIIPLSNWIDRDDRTWYHGWTVFYWAWWISWAPAVGIFIARISRGRTVREFVLAVLLIPTAVTLLWMSVMGGTALKLAEKGNGVLAGGITDVSQTMFEMFSQLPLSGVISLLALMLILLFLITSYHSGSQMVDDMATGGLESPSVTRQLFWIAAAGGIATLLLISGGSAGLASLQAGTTGLPFTIVLIMMCLSLSVGLKSEWHLYKSREGDKQ